MKPPNDKIFLLNVSQNERQYKTETTVSPVAIDAPVSSDDLNKTVPEGAGRRMLITLYNTAT